MPTRIDNHDEGLRHRCSVPWPALILGLAFAASPALALVPWVKLSAGLPFSDVGPFALSPDGKWAVYTQDAEADGTVELWSVPVYGGTPRRLCGVLPSGSSVGPFAITPNSQRVVYLAPQDTPGVDELYVVPIAGGASTKLNGPLVAGGNVMEFSLYADGGSVLYRADELADERFELFSVSVVGSPPQKVNGPLTTGGDVIDFLAVPGQAFVLYRADQATDGVTELYAAPYGFTSACRLSGSLVAGGNVLSYDTTPDGLWVVYLADQDTDGVTELYRINIFGCGGVPTKINGALVANGDVASYALAPAGRAVVYRADQQSDGVYELWSAQLSGGSATKISGTMTAGGDVVTYAISPDGGRVVYRADQQSDEVDELWSVPFGGGTAVKLNGDLTSGGDVSTFAISPQGDWVVYQADQILDEYPMGFRVPLAGPAASATTIWLEAYAFGWAIDAPRGRVIVSGNEALADSIVRLWSFPLDGTPAPNNGIELVPQADFDPDGDVEAFVVSGDGSILYRADQTVNERYDLYSLSTTVFWDGFETGNTSAWSPSPPDARRSGFALWRARRSVPYPSSLWCRSPGSNRDVPFGTEDFKSPASAISPLRQSADSSMNPS